MLCSNVDVIKYRILCRDLRLLNSQECHSIRHAYSVQKLTYSGRFTHISGHLYSCKLSIGQGKFANQDWRSTHCTMQPNLAT